MTIIKKLLGLINRQKIAAVRADHSISLSVLFLPETNKICINQSVEGHKR